MLKGFLRKLNDALRSPDTDIFPLTPEVLHQGFRRFGEVGLQAIQRAVDNRVLLTLKLLTESFIFEPPVDRCLAYLGALASFLDGRRRHQIRDHSFLFRSEFVVIVHFRSDSFAIVETLHYAERNFRLCQSPSLKVIRLPVDAFALNYPLARVSLYSGTWTHLHF